MSGAVRRAPQGAGPSAAAAKHIANEGKLVRLSPENVMMMAIGFIVVVFVLHILGKMAS